MNDLHLAEVDSVLHHYVESIATSNICFMNNI